MPKRKSENALPDLHDTCVQSAFSSLTHLAARLRWTLHPCDFSVHQRQDSCVKPSFISVALPSLSDNYDLLKVQLYLQTPKVWYSGIGVHKSSTLQASSLLYTCTGNPQKRKTTHAYGFTHSSWKPSLLVFIYTVLNGGSAARHLHADPKLYQTLAALDLQITVKIICETHRRSYC